MIIGFDTDSHLSVADAASAFASGARWVALYLHNDLTQDVPNAFAADLAVLLIQETSSQRALSGAVAGRSDGEEWVTRATALAAQIGVPLPATVAACSTFDFDVLPGTQQSSCVAYQTGFRAGAPNRPGVAYANGALLTAFLASGIVNYPWVAGGRGMRGTQQFLGLGSHTEPVDFTKTQADLVQDVGNERGINIGISIDSDIAVDESVLQWMWQKAA